MNTYECMYILQTSLSDDETQKANRRIVEEIEKRGGSIRHRERLGKKRLAYRIGKQDDGVYHLMYFDLPPGEVASLRAGYKLHPRLLRFLILRRELDEIPKLQKRAPREAGRHEAADEEGSDTEGESADAESASEEGEPEEGEGDSEPGEPPDEPPDEEEAPEDADEEVEPEKQE